MQHSRRGRSDSSARPWTRRPCRDVGSIRVLKVARTIADLAGAERTDAEHVGEALSYREALDSWGRRSVPAEERGERSVAPERVPAGVRRGQRRGRRRLGPSVSARDHAASVARRGIGVRGARPRRWRRLPSGRPGPTTTAGLERAVGLIGPGFELADAGARFARPGDPEYWPALLRLDDPPVGVFCRGRPLSPEHRRVAIVGSRRPSPTGVEVARSLAHGIRARGPGRDERRCARNRRPRPRGRPRRGWLDGRGARLRDRPGLSGHEPGAPA